MSTPEKDGRPTPRRGRGDDGAALVEFALICVLLFTLVFGIIQFGLILSFKQDVTRAAAEGARGGAVAIPISGNNFSAAAQTAATSATNDAVKAMGGKFKNTGCTGSMHCTVQIVNCPGQITYQCVTVTVQYDYGDDPLYGNIPLMSALMPDTVQSTSVARINS